MQRERPYPNFIMWPWRKMRCCMERLARILILIGVLTQACYCLNYPTLECDTSFGAAILGQKAKCKAYPRIESIMDHITLKGNHLSTIKRLSPSHILLNKCSGDCAGLTSMKCLPRRSEIVNVPISVATCTADYDCTETCTMVQLVNHTSCHCSCNLDSRSCKGTQVFMTDECQCRCPNVQEKMECLSKLGRRWDDEMCRCYCPPQTFAICEEDQVYDFRHECRCISREKLWSESGSTALRLSWEMAIIMVLSCLAFFLVTLAVVLAKKLSLLTTGSTLPYSQNSSRSASLMYRK